MNSLFSQAELDEEFNLNEMEEIQKEKLSDQLSAEAEKAAEKKTDPQPTDEDIDRLADEEENEMSDEQLELLQVGRAKGYTNPDLPPPVVETEPETPTLFDGGEWWSDDWKDMPEFQQKHRKKPYAQFIFRVKTQEDLEKLSLLLEQKITPTTKTVWYPEIPINHTKFWRYQDEK